MQTLTQVFQNTAITIDDLRDEIQGLQAPSYWFDEVPPWGSKQWSFTYKDFKLRPVATYETERYPAATVEIFREGLDTKDPRHPNPRAGPLAIWIIKCGDRKIGRPFKSLGPAKMKARAIHEQMVQKLDEQAAEDQLTELDRIAAHPIAGRF